MVIIPQSPFEYNEHNAKKGVNRVFIRLFFSFISYFACQNRTRKATRVTLFYFESKFVMYVPIINGIKAL